MSLAPVSANTAVLPAIRAAARASGVDFSYLVQQAQVESGLDPAARAATSSATGLFQFIESTWLDMAGKYGAKYGLAGSKQDLLAARTDPQMASYMAAELARENTAALQTSWGGKVGQTELYLAHFLGAGGAAELLNAKDAAPGASAAALLPGAAASNRAVFYGPDGAARSVGEVYDRFATKFGEDGEVLPLLAEVRSGGEPPPRTTSTPPVSLSVPETGESVPRQPVLDPVAIMLLAQLDAPETGQAGT